MLGFDWKKGLSRLVGASLAVVMLTVVGAVSPAHAADPTVMGVGSPTTSGFYKVGTLIEVRVQFSEIVNVTGIPTLQLETGTTDRVLFYATGSGTNTLIFAYLISSTDTSDDLDYLATTSLVLAGGSTIKNVTNENAVLTLAAPGAPGSLANSKNIVIDNTVPTVSVTTATVGSTQNAVAQSNERGRIFLVKITNATPITTENQILGFTANTRTTGTAVATADTDTNVPAAMLTSGEYKVYAADAAGNLSLPSTNTVTVDAVAPFIGMMPLNTPLGDASRISVQSSEAGTAYLVRSTVPVTNKASILAAQTANTADVNEATIAAPNTNTSLATTTLTPGNFILYAVDAYDNLSFPFSFPITIGIDSSAPTMLGATPFSGDLEAGVAANIVLRFNEPVAKSNDSKTFTLARTIVPTITGAVLSGTVETITFSSNPGLVVTDKITIASCTETTLNGSAMAISAVSSASPWTVTFANTTGTANSPTSCAYSATDTDNVTLITTSEVIASNNAIVTVGSFPTDDTVTINPAGKMLFGVSYYVLITAGAIVDKAGIPNIFMGIPSATPQFYRFTTGNDTTAPTLNGAQSDPPNGMTTFTPDRSITLKFSETVLAVANKYIKLCTGAVNCATPVETFTLETSTGTGVSVSSSLVTINPTADLSFSTTYFLLIEAGAFKDGSNNTYLGITSCVSLPCTYQFATMAVPVPGVTPVFVAPTGPAPTGPAPTGPCVYNCYVAPPQFLPGMIGIIIGPPPSFGANGVPLGLTAGNMAGVDPSAFRNFNPNDSRGLTTDAMGGFSSGQMAALPPSAMGGFNSSQMSALPPSAMGGFSSGQMAALPPSAMGGFNSSQMSALPPSAMGGFNSSQFAALPPSAMGGFSQSQFMVLPPSAMGGFNSSQMAALPPSAMGAFKPDQMAALPPSAMGGMNQGQFKVLPASAMSGFNSNQMGALPPDAISGFKLDQMKSLPPTAITGMQQGQFAALPPQAMIGFKPDQFAALGASAISGMQQNQFKAIPPAAMGAFTPTQMDAMPNGALSVISPRQFKSLTPDVIASMSPEQRNALPQAALNPAANAAPTNTGNASALAGALTGWNIDKVPANSFNSFKPTDAAKLSPETFSAMNPEQFKAMPANAFAGFKPDQVAALSPQAFSAMKPAQMASLPTNAFGSFNTEQLGALPAAAFGAMKPNQVGAMPPTLMASMSPQQVGALPATAVAGLKADQVDALPPAAFAGMKAAQVGALTPSAVSSLSVDQVGALPAAAFGAMKPNQVGALPAEAIASMSPQQVGALPATAVAGLKADQVGQLDAATFGALKPAQLAAFKPGVADGVTVEQLEKLTPLQVKSLPKAFVANLDPEQRAAINP